MASSRALLLAGAALLGAAAPASASTSLTLRPSTSTSTQLRFAVAGLPLTDVTGATLRLGATRTVALSGARVRAGARAGRIVLQVRATRRERSGARLMLRLRPRAGTTSGSDDHTEANADDHANADTGAGTSGSGAPEAPADTTPPPAVGTDIPVGLHGLLRWRSGDDLDRTVDTLADAGVTVDREDLSWYRVQPTRGAAYDWTYADRMVGAAARGIRILVVLDDPPDWATGAWNAPPLAGEALAGFTAFARAAIRRYGSTGSFWTAHPGLPKTPVREWEIWNEPYLTYSWVGSVLPDPLAYGRLFRDVVAAVEPEDAQARFLLAANTGVSQAPFPYPPYLAALLEGVPGLAALVDAVAVHPYATDPSRCTPYAPSKGVAHDYVATIYEFCKVQDVRRILDAHGLTSTGIWITEMGWSTASAADETVSEARQADNVHTVFALLRQWRLVEGVVYTLADVTGAGDADREGHFGLRHADGSPKPAWNAFADEAGTGVPGP